MAILQSCCCWRSLRKGGYASAAYTMTYFAISILIMSLFVEEEWGLYAGDKSVPESSSFLEHRGMTTVTAYFNLVMLIWACIGFMSSLILIIGIYRDIKCLLIPWAFAVVIMIILDLAHTAFLFAYESTKFEPMTAILFTLDFFHITLTVYSLLCVVSLYQEYKAGRGTADFEYLNRRVPGVRYASQPTGTSFLSTRRAVTYHETRASPTGSPPHERTASQRKHVQFGDDRTWLTPPPPSVIHIESPKVDRKPRQFRTSSNSTRSSNISFDSATSGDLFHHQSSINHCVQPASPISLESTIQDSQGSAEYTQNQPSAAKNFSYLVDTDLTHDSVSSEMNGRSGASPSEEGNSSGEWPGVKTVVDTEPLIALGKPQITI